ncbi:MAG TPA: molybdopterin molybdotransferase MoeA [Firmicutes bacterium]|nr:molybdopterin molybdotransferase MoeA [Candidatus Fermentithermobacillaceae bacterium]
MEDFFEVKTVAEAWKTLCSYWTPAPLGVETLSLLESLGRVLAVEVRSREDLPPYSRATVDGYAVIAKDTFGASQALPSMLRVVGEIPMGKVPEIALSPGEAARISTGGVLPEQADACVMLEHTVLLEDGVVLVEKPVAPGENVVRKGEDIPRGQVVLAAGRVLGPYELGALAATGETSVPVVKKPTVAVISSGDEIVPAGTTPAPGEIRDINSYSLAASVIKALGTPVLLGISRDTYEDVRRFVEAGIDRAELVVISGGSSVGTKDVVLKVLSDLGPPGVVVHGVAVRPGKPVILAVCRGKPVFGLPGHPVSCLTAFDLFVLPAIVRAYRGTLGLGDESLTPGPSLGRAGLLRAPTGPLRTGMAPNSVTARLSRNLSSAPGREDHIRVKLREEEGVLWADPVLGKSGLISVMVNSDGEIVIPLEREGLRAGEEVVVKLTNPAFPFPV